MDDEDFLVENEEEMDIKEEPLKVTASKEYLGKIQYKVWNSLIFFKKFASELGT